MSSQRSSWMSKNHTTGRGLLSDVVRELGLRILNGTYAPEHVIATEPELMAELHVSRTLLREAIKILAAKGLIESRTKTGTRVRSRKYWNLLDPIVLRLYCQVVDYSDFALSFQQIRLIIEPEAAALAAENRSAGQLRALDSAYRAMADAKEIDSWTDADLRFHEAILDATGNPFMRPLGSLIRTALETLLFHSAKISTNPFDSLVDHKNVLECIRKRDAKAARKAMKALLAGTGLSIDSTLKSKRRHPAKLAVFRNE